MEPAACFSAALSLSVELERDGHAWSEPGVHFQSYNTSASTGREMMQWSLRRVSVQRSLSVELERDGHAWSEPGVHFQSYNTSASTGREMMQWSLRRVSVQRSLS